MFTDPYFAVKYGGPAGRIRIDPAVSRAALARFRAYFPASSWTNDLSCDRLEEERNPDTMIETTVHANGREFSVTVSGPFDRTNWDYASVDLDLDDEAAFVGSGRTARSAIENCVRSVAGTAYDDSKPALERETQIFLESFAGSDVEQGDGYTKLYCVIKVKK